MTLLNIDHVSLQFPGSSHEALNKINYAMDAGDFVIVLGSNGSGKSTLLKLLHRDYAANSGKVYLLDKLLQHYTDREFSQTVAVLTQNYADSLFTSLTIFENYKLYKHFSTLSSLEEKTISLSPLPLAGEGRVRARLMKYLSDFNPNLAKKLDRTMDQLSGGEKQALAFALCLLKQPKLLLLDEHTSALDPKTSEQIMQLTKKMVEKYHITCMLTTHDLDIALQYGNKILALREGKIHQCIDNKEKKLLRKEHLLNVCY